MVAIPRPQAALSNRAGYPTNEWYTYFLQLRDFAGLSESQVEQLNQLAARIAELENSSGSGGFQIMGVGSVQVFGTPAGGIVQIYLEGDVDQPGASWYYGTGPDGTRSWFALADAFEVTADLTKAVDADTGVTTFGLADLADTGVGAALVRITRDSKGRVAGTQSASTTDLAEGTNLYFTAERAQDAVGSILDGTGNVPLTYDDAGNAIRAGLSAAVIASLGRADTAVQEVQAGTGITVNNADPRRPIVNAIPATPGIPEAPNDTLIYARGSLDWQPLTGPQSRYHLLQYPLLTDQLGNQLTDQLGRPLWSNAPQVPYSWLTGVPANLAAIAPLTGTGYAFRSSGGAWSLQTLGDIHTLVPMTLAAANALTPTPSLGRMVLITDLTGGAEPCWYDAAQPVGMRWRRCSDRSVAS